MWFIIIKSWKKFEKISLKKSGSVILFLGKPDNKELKSRRFDPIFSTYNVIGLNPDFNEFLKSNKILK